MNEFITIIALAGITAIVLITYGHLFTTVTIRQHETALVFKNGKLLRQLAAGKHRLLGPGIEIIQFDSRWADMTIQGQEFLTADKAGLKVSANVRYRIKDAIAFHESSEAPLTILYVSAQLALRDSICSLELDKALDRNNSLTNDLTSAVRVDAEKLGIEIDTVAVKDIIVSGDIRRVYAEALTAKQQSLITLEQARAEAAAMRTLANGAKVFENHPALMQLKFLQTLERAEGGIAQPLALGTAGQWLDFLRK